MLLRTARAVSAGALIGLVAGIMTAFADFGAHWLWLEGWGDRAGLLLRLLGLQGPVGAALGAGLGVAFGATEGALVRTSERLAIRFVLSGEHTADAARALRLAALLAPALIAIGALLWSGGSMSRTAGKSLLQAATCALLVLLAFAAAYVLHRVHARVRQRPLALRACALSAFAAGFALAKLNQWVLPKLYDYLHAALTAAAFALFMVGTYQLAISRPWPRALARALPAAFVPVLVLAALSLLGTLFRLDANQNVRVALLHPNAAHARSVMQALAPYVIEPAQREAMEQARQRARLARARRPVQATHGTGPVYPDAHVLLITVDALRADHLGSYGYKRDTSPNLDRLAEQSVVFEHAYAPAPHSSYSLCSLMASEYLHETLDLGRPPPHSTLPSVLGEAGYHTAAFYTAGIFHTAGARLEYYAKNAFGFARHEQTAYDAEVLTERVLAEVDRTAQRGEPSSFIWAHYFDVHEPYLATHFGTSDMDRYDSEIRRVDAEIDRLIRSVRQRLSRDVIVVISADHGEEFRDHGGLYHGSTLYEEQVRVPLIVNARGLAPRRVAAPVSTVDLAPTVLGLLGLRAADTMRGRDLRPAATGAVNDFGPAFSAVIHKKMVVRWPHKLIADLRFGLFELYDLERDPRERENLADQHEDLVSELRLEVYGWLDSLAPPNKGEDAITAALDWGRLGDRRAVEPLSRLLAEGQGDTDQRVEAARMLGHLADESVTEHLRRAMQNEAAPRVAAEAAIALGRMFDARAREALRALVRSEDPDIRVRAAVSLGRLRDREAVPALIEALWIANADYERQEAVRWLGRLRDPRALQPLIDMLPESRTRFLVVVAIGQIGDPRAYERLVGVLAWDRMANVRDATLQGLGLLGDPRAIDLIAPLAAEEPSYKYASESLVRLGAIRVGAIGGVDVAANQSGLSGFARCHEDPLDHDWIYLHRTHCTTRKQGAKLQVQVPKAVSDNDRGAVLVLGIKRIDAASAAALRLSIAGHNLEPAQTDGSWTELRWTLPAGMLRAGRAQVRLEAADPNARFAVDHLLLLPRTSVIVAHQGP